MNTAKPSSELIVVDRVCKDFVINLNRNTSLKSAFLFWRKPEYEVRTVLQDITFTVSRGESLALIGRNGAGKSTLLSVIARIYQATSGTCTLNGRIAPLLELGAGFHPDLSGLENLRMNAMLLGLSLKEVARHEASIIEFSELGPYINEPVRKYSSGMVAKLGFAVVSHVDADVLVVDEALAVGDFKFRAKCEQFLHDYQEAGGTLLFVSHDDSLVRTVAQRAIWLEGGRVKMDGPSSEVMGHYLGGG